MERTEPTQHQKWDRPEPAPTTLPLRRRVTRGAIGVAVALLGGVLVLYALQAELIFPGARRQGQPATEVKPRDGEELVTLSTPHGDRVVALFAPALLPDGKTHPNPAAAPTLLYFYGNGMCTADVVEAGLLDRLRTLGCNVFVPDYVGYGMSGGKPSESGCQATADAALAHLLTRKDVDPAKVFAVGWSLGGAVAVDLAARKDVAGLIIFSTFTSMTEMSRKNFPFLPASLLLRHKFDNRTKIAQVDCPILIGHGRRDELIPYAMAERLAASARVPVMKFTVEDAGHNDFFTVGDEQVFASMRKFIGQSLPEKD